MSSSLEPLLPVSPDMHENQLKRDCEVIEKARAEAKQQQM